MHQRIIASVLLCLIASCGEAPPEQASTPSPLLSADSDRLWILARAARVGDGKECSELYLLPDDPRYQGQAQQCDFWTRNYADYLAINGFPTIEHLHLQERVYWQWYLDKRNQISLCIQTVGKLSVTATGPEMADHARRKHECDPFDDARNNQGLTLDALGIRYK